MAKYLITGASGFVGRHLITRLQQSEAEVLATDMQETLPFTEPKVVYKQLNLNDAAQTAALISEFKPDYLVNLAGSSSVGQSWKEPKACFENNISIVFNILEAVRLQGLKTRILLIGSSEEYGETAKEGILTEESPLKPISPYAVAKVSQEMLAKMYVQGYGLDIVMTRSFNHIGPGQRDTFVIPSFIKQMIDIKNNRQENKLFVGNVDVQRDFTDVRDVVDAYLLLLRSAPSGQPFNVSSGNAVSLKYIIEICSSLLQISPALSVDPHKFREHDLPSVCGNNSKLSSLGWNKYWSLDQSLLDIINFTGYYKILRR